MNPHRLARIQQGAALADEERRGYRYTRRGALALGLAAAGSTLLSGCLSTSRHPYISKIYDSPAQRHSPDRNPIIVIPGILGSRLEVADSGELAWGILGGGYLRHHFEDIAFPMEEGKALSELHDNLVPAGVLDRVRVNLGASIQVKAYGQLLSSLGVGGYRDETLGTSGAIDYGNEHFTCFQFGYDWRRSSVENAALLGAFIREKKAYVETENRKRYGDSRPVRFDLVAHSMGSLVARYFLQYRTRPLPTDGSLPALDWSGARDVEKLIVVAPPNAGSTTAAEQLLNGYRPAPILGEFPPALLGTMPALYELLPRHRHGSVIDETDTPVNLFDPAVWKERQLGLLASPEDATLKRLLPSVDSRDERLRVAEDHLQKCLVNAERFHAALDRPAARPENTRLYLFAGDATPTLDRIRLTGKGRALKDAEAPGDGTVTRASALLSASPDKDGFVPRSPVDWNQTTFIAADHLGLTSNATFTDNVLHLLLDS